MKIKVTTELAKLLRDRRISLGLKANELSRDIGLNPAHQSKIENHQIKTMDFDLFQKYLETLYPDKSLEVILKEIYDYLEYWYPSETIRKQLWLYNLEASRKVSLSKKLVSFIKESEHFYESLSYNLALPLSEADYKTYNCIEFFGITSIPYFKMNLTHSEIKEILERETTSYLNIFALVFYATHSKCQLSYSEWQEHWKETETLLASYGISTVYYKREHIKGVHDLENDSIITELLNLINNASSQDMNLVNERLTSFVSNLKWDIGFMLKLVSLNYKVNLNSFEKKKTLLEKIENLVKQFQEENKDTFNIYFY